MKSVRIFFRVKLLHLSSDSSLSISFDVCGTFISFNKSAAKCKKWLLVQCDRSAGLLTGRILSANFNWCRKLWILLCRAVINKVCQGTHCVSSSPPSRCCDASLGPPSHDAPVIICLVCIHCCITSRQLYNSPTCTRSLAAGPKHVSSCCTACPEQTKPAGSVWGQI